MADDTIVTVKGFSFAGIACGIKDEGKRDLAVIYSESPRTTTAGVFTKNRICAAPVVLSRTVAKKGRARLIVINSGNANAATGPGGMRDAVAVRKMAAAVFGVPPAEIFLCSTGKIGVRLPLPKIVAGLTAARRQLRNDGFSDASEAIRTTDRYRKTVVHHGTLDGHAFTIAVMAKGAGMIAPDMATLLCFVLTDLAIERAELARVLRAAVDGTLNCLTVDGDTSTNDSAIALASGVADNATIRSGSKAAAAIQKILTGLLCDITQQIALDGEGATKCLVINVNGAATVNEAKLAARAIGDSQLVKTAMFGCDPNWGRILAAAGYSGARLKEDKAMVAIGPHRLFERGHVRGGSLTDVANYLKATRVVPVTVSLGVGRSSAHVFASDLTYDYVKLNAEYHT